MPDLTHHPECWRDPKHHACAVREVERLRGIVRGVACQYRRRSSRRYEIPGEVVARAVEYVRALERVEEGGE